MTLKEFLTNNPEAVNEAANCKSVKEFQDLAAKVGLTFNSSSDAQEAFNMVKDSNNGELGDDALNAVSGGAVYAWDSSKVAWNQKTGDIITLGTGKKQKSKTLK